MASSYIEGLIIGGRRLLRAEAADLLGARADVTANEVLGNIRAMDHAVRDLANEPLTTPKRSPR